MSEQRGGGRYQRSALGMVGAMIATLVLVLGFVALRSIGRDNPEAEPDAVDYLETVELIQSGGETILYPETLPDGWTATSVDVQPGSPPTWGMGMLTADGRFVGLRQERADREELLAAYVDEQVADEGPVDLAGVVPGPWREFADDGGDTAYAATAGGREVLVFGSADPEDLRTLVATLTDAAL